MQLLITFFQEATTNNADWLTVAYIKTFSGVSFVIYMLVNTYQKLFNKKPIYVALLLSLILTIYVFVDFDYKNFEIGHIILIPVNALFVFSSALGITQLSTLPNQGAAGQQDAMVDTTQQRRHFSTSWLQ